MDGEKQETQPTSFHARIRHIACQSNSSESGCVTERHVERRRWVKLIDQALDEAEARKTLAWLMSIGFSGQRRVSRLATAIKSFTNQILPLISKMGSLAVRPCGSPG